MSFELGAGGSTNWGGKMADDSAFEQFEQDYRVRANALVARINELSIGLTREGIH